ncbi:ribonuclease PH [Candidatus Dependentiae bacterium]|nr:ribonuclease PH [Candidatus Dependentiae bacterium]
MKRVGNRAADRMRKVTVTYNAFGQAPGNVLIELGNTKVLCSVSMQQHVPPFLKGTKTGWLTAEYSMLPMATRIRVQRASSAVKKNSRSIEISRLIGRSLRSIIKLEKFGERTIIVDCDVLHADGSTRTAAISGSYLALRQAIQTWLYKGILTGGSVEDYLVDGIAAVSVGIADGVALLDINFAEDSQIDADYNFVLTRSGSVIEIQGSSEKALVSWQQFDAMRTLAIKGVSQLFKEFERISPEVKSRDKVSLFSLANRQKTLQ